jgi:hypothetical protein
VLKIALRVFVFLAGGFAVLLLALYAFFYFAFAPSRDEVFTAKSSDGRFVARLFEINGGATTSFGYLITVAESGPLNREKEVANLYGAVRNNSAYGANLRWVTPRQLSIEYLDAHQSEVLQEKVEFGKEEVSIVLAPNTPDVSAPAGGMLYNLQGRR